MSMTTVALEKRLKTLEQKVEKLLHEREDRKEEMPWWNQWFGAFRDNPDFDAAMQRGEEFRKSQPNAVDDPGAVIL